MSGGFDLILAIVDAACALRDVDWREQPSSKALQDLEDAIDAWRQHLRLKDNRDRATSAE